jgi:hypothetical protein
MMNSQTVRAVLLSLAAGVVASCGDRTAGTGTGGAGFDEMRSVGEQYEPGNED